MIAITDHAMLRFIEREMGIDTDELRDQVGMQVARAAAAAAQLGVVNYNVQAGGRFYLVRDLVVVSVFPENAGVGARCRSLPAGKGAREK